MDEKYFKDKISGYFDGDLKPDEMEMMTEWLKNSPEGQQALAEVGRLDEFVRRQSEIGGSEDFWERQAQKIEARLGFEGAVEEVVTDIRPKKASGLGWKMAAAAASIVVLLYVGVNKDEIFGPDIVGTVLPSMAADSTEHWELKESGEDATAQSGTVSDDFKAGLPQDIDGREDFNLDGARDKADEAVVAPPSTSRLREDQASASGGTASRPSSPTSTGGAEEQKIVEKDKPVRVGIPSPISPPPSSPTPKAIQENSVDRTAAPATTERKAEPVTVDAGEDRAKEKDQSNETVAPDLSKSITVPAEEHKQTLNLGVTRSVDAEIRSLDTSLSRWRATYARTDSTLNTLSKAPSKTGLQIPEASNSLTRKGSPAATAVPKADRTAIESEMLEACFRIAENSPDSTEAVRMRNRLSKIAADGKSLNQKLAQSYLDRLTVRK